MAWRLIHWLISIQVWRTEGSQGGLPNWQDLTLRVHTHVRSGDRVYEWNYGLGDNDYGSYHYAPKKLSRSSSFYFCANGDGDRDRVEADWPDECDEAAVNSVIWCIDYDIKNVECTPLVRFENPASWYQGGRFERFYVVEFASLGAGYLKSISEAFSSNHPHLGPFALDDRVSANGDTMNETFNLASIGYQ